MTDTYSVLPAPGRWRVLREGDEVASYPTREEALTVAGRLKAAVLGRPSFTPKPSGRRNRGRPRPGC